MKKLILLSWLIFSVLIYISQADTNINEFMSTTLFETKITGRTCLLILLVIIAGYWVGYDDWMEAVKQANSSNTPFSK